MKKSSYLKLLSLGAVALSGHVYAAATEFVAAESTAGMKWTTVDWSNGVPGESDTATVSIGDSDNPLVVDGNQVLGKLDVNGSTYLLIDGEGNSLKTTITGSPYGDVILNGDSKLEVKNGASLTLASGMSLKAFGNSSVLFDNATFTGKFDNALKSAVFQNGSQVNLQGGEVNVPNGYDILIKDSSVTSTGDVKFRYGSSASASKVLTLDNSDWNLNRKGFSASGIINLINSSATDTPHFNLGFENGASGVNILTVQGTADKTAEISGDALWVNSGAGATTSLVLAGNTDAKFGNVNSGSSFTSSDEVSIKFEGTDNVFYANDWTNFANNRGNGKSTSGNWIITTAKTVEGEEELAENTSASFNQFAFAGSKDTENASSIQAKIDWAGASNSFTVRGNLAFVGDMNAESTSVKSVIVRDGAEFTVNGGTYLGSESNQNALGGRNELIVTDGSYFKTNGLTLRNSGDYDSTVYNYVKFDEGATASTGGINIATDRASSGISIVEISGDATVTRGTIKIGNANSDGGEAWLKIKDNAGFTSGNISIDVNQYTADAKFGIILDNSTMTGGWGMGAGSESKFLILQNGSVWDANTQGINIAGTVEVLDTSSIKNSAHFNIGAESGKTSGYNKLYLKGTDADNMATVEITNLWINANPEAQTIIHQDGNSSFTFVNGGKIDSGSAFEEADVQWIFQGDNNSFTGNGSGRWGDNLKGKTEFGSWIITTAQEDEEGNEVFATNTSFKMTGNLDLRGSDVVDNSFEAIIDWAGSTNTFSVSNLNIYSSKAAYAEDALASATFRDGAVAEFTGALRINHGDMKSGTAETIFKDGAVLNQKSNVIIQNSKVADATTVSRLVIDNANINRTSGDLRIGVTDDGWQHAVAGEASVEIRNSEFTYTGGILLAASDAKIEDGVPLDEYTNVSKLIVDSSKLTLTSEVYMGHNNSNGGTIYGGSSYIILTGEDSEFITTNKTLYSGYNTTFYGGDRHIEIDGTNNKMLWGTNSSESFKMSAAGGVKQLGGSFDITMTGAGNTFGACGMQIGATNAMAGSNTFYSKGDSKANKNQVLMINGGYTIEIRGATSADSEIVNTFELAGNTVLTRDNGESVNINIGSTNMAGGTAQFIVSGENNVVNGYTATIGNSSGVGGKVLFQVEGSTHDINFASFFSFKGNKDVAELAYVADAKGISTISVDYVDAFNGLLSIDFSEYVVREAGTKEFVLITSNGSLPGDNYCVTSGDVSDIVKVTVANEGDTWELAKRDNDFLFIYTSSVPEPATYAAIFGAIAIAVAMMRRRSRN